MTKAPTPTEMSKGQSDNTNNATKKFDYTAVADRLRTVNWSNYSHPTGVVYRFGIEKQIWIEKCKHYMRVGTGCNMGYVPPPLSFPNIIFIGQFALNGKFYQIFRMASLADQDNWENTYIPLLLQMNKPSIFYTANTCIIKAKESPKINDQTLSLPTLIPSLSVSSWTVRRWEIETS